MATVLESIACGEQIRVLVVDDSAVMRRMISRIFEGDPALHVVGVACDGFDALAGIRRHKPHVVILDVEPLNLGGLEALAEISEHHPDIRVIMLSRLTAEAAPVTIEALMFGASDYVTRPSSAIGRDFDRLRAELLFKVKQFSVKTLRDLGEQTASVRPTPIASAVPFEICAVGISTGGPSALLEALPMFPANFPLPIVIVQHMPAMFTKLFADRLNGACSIAVAEGTNGMILQPGHAIVAPGGFHLRVVRSGRAMVVDLDEGPRENSCRPAVDVLFRSIAENVKGRAIAAVLTGMGQDGLAGARRLKQRGATILAQDQATSVVWGMPGAIVAANLADRVLPLRRMVPEILQLAGIR